MTRPLTAALAFAALLSAAPALAQTTELPRSGDLTTGSTGAGGGSGLRYENDGNAKNPAGRVSTEVPAYQQGSGQETGGPAKELIPR